MDRPVRVLYVDGNNEAAAAMAKELSSLDGHYDVAVESRGEAARERLSGGGIDCVVSAYELPDQNGIDLLRTVREEYPRVPFVLVPADGSEALASEAISAGVTEYLSLEKNPEQYALLASTIEDVITDEPAKDRLLEQSQILGTVLENVPLFLFTVDDAGKITRLQGKALDRVGLEPTTAIGKSVSELFADLPTVLDGYEQALEGNPATEVVEIDGHVFQTWFQPLNSYETRITGVVGLAVDITTRAERARELERQNEQLEQFANVVSHDLRNPLQVAKGNVELAVTTDDSGDLAKARDSLDRMEAIIDDVLTLARHGQTISETVPTDLEDIARAAWQTTSTGDMSLSVVSSTELDAAPDRLQQLFENLYRNSLEHGGASTVTVGSIDPMPTSTRMTKEDRGGFYVADDGQGIPEEQRASVFEPGVSTLEDGTGLGLAIVGQIVDAHGWDARVTENHDGGARFEVTGTRSDRPL